MIALRITADLMLIGALTSIGLMAGYASIGTPAATTREVVLRMLTAMGGAAFLAVAGALVLRIF